MNSISAASPKAFVALVADVFARERGNIDDVAAHPSRDEGIVNTLAYIFRAIVEHGDTTLLSSLQNLSEATVATAEGIVQGISESASIPEKGVGAAKRALNIGTLVSLDWKVGIALASSQCDSLLAPYITLVFKVRNSTDDVVTQAVELTLPEFQEISKTLVEVSAKLDQL